AAFAELDRFDAGASRGEVYPLGRVQSRLPADAALLAWVDLRRAPHAADPNGEHWAVVVRHRGAPRWVKLPRTGPAGGRTADDELAQDHVRVGLGTSPVPGSDLAGWARRLAGQRLAPVRPHLQAHDDLPAVRRLIVLPAGWLAGIPVEALTDEYAVSYAPSATLYARLGERPRT